MDADQRYLTQPEAATLCACDYSTIKRYRERSRFPGIRRRDDTNGTYEIPLSDLIAAGLWKPTDGDDEDVAAAIGRTRAERRVEELRVELERTRAQNEALTAALADRRDEVAYLRRALDVALGTGRVA
jgi:hypothetical protein